MPNITLYLDNNNYVGFQKLKKENQDEIREKLKELLKVQIELKKNEQGLGVDNE